MLIPSQTEHSTCERHEKLEVDLMNLGTNSYQNNNFWYYTQGGSHHQINGSPEQIVWLYFKRIGGSATAV
jgi:hypothetical protein